MWSKEGEGGRKGKGGGRGRGRKGDGGGILAVSGKVRPHQENILFSHHLTKPKFMYESTSNNDKHQPLQYIMPKHLPL